MKFRTEESGGVGANKTYADAEVIAEFQIAHVGWEMDNDAWIAKLPDGSKAFLETSHGGMPTVSTADSLRKIRDQHKAWLDGIDAALRELEGKA